MLPKRDAMKASRSGKLSRSFSRSSSRTYLPAPKAADLLVRIYLEPQSGQFGDYAAALAERSGGYTFSALLAAAGQELRDAQFAERALLRKASMKEQEAPPTPLKTQASVKSQGSQKLGKQASSMDLTKGFSRSGSNKEAPRKLKVKPGLASRKSGELNHKEIQEPNRTYVEDEKRGTPPVVTSPKMPPAAKHADFKREGITKREGMGKKVITEKKGEPENPNVKESAAKASEVAKSGEAAEEDTKKVKPKEDATARETKPLPEKSLAEEKDEKQSAVKEEAVTTKDSKGEKPPEGEESIAKPSELKKVLSKASHELKKFLSKGTKSGAKVEETPEQKAAEEVEAPKLPKKVSLPPEEEKRLQAAAKADELARGVKLGDPREGEEQAVALSKASVPEKAAALSKRIASAEETTKVQVMSSGSGEESKRRSVSIKEPEAPPPKAAPVKPSAKPTPVKKTAAVKRTVKKVAEAKEKEEDPKKDPGAARRSSIAARTKAKAETETKGAASRSGRPATKSSTSMERAKSREEALAKRRVGRRSGSGLGGSKDGIRAAVKEVGAARGDAKKREAAPQNGSEPDARDKDDKLVGDKKRTEADEKEPKGDETQYDRKAEIDKPLKNEKLLSATPGQLETTDPSKTEAPAKSETPDKPKTFEKSKAPAEVETPEKPKTSVEGKTKTPAEVETPEKPKTSVEGKTKTPAEPKPKKPKSPTEPKTPASHELILEPDTGIDRIESGASHKEQAEEVGSKDGTGRKGSDVSASSSEAGERPIKDAGNLVKEEEALQAVIRRAMTLEKGEIPEADEVLPTQHAAKPDAMQIVAPQPIEAELESSTVEQPKPPQQQTDADDNVQVPVSEQPSRPQMRNRPPPMGGPEVLPPSVHRFASVPDLTSRLQSGDIDGLEDKLLRYRTDPEVNQRLAEKESAIERNAKHVVERMGGSREMFPLVRRSYCSLLKGCCCSDCCMMDNTPDRALEHQSNRQMYQTSQEPRRARSSF